MNEQIINETKKEMTAGEMLKNARTTGRKKREISTMSKLLCIREEFLEALENCNYRVIPENVYIFGFARSYATELGLNPDEIILKIKKEMGLLQEEVENEDVKSEKVDIDTKNNDSSNWQQNALKYIKKHWILLVSFFCILIVFIVLLGFMIGRDNKEKDNTKNITLEDGITVIQVKEPDFRYPIHERFEIKNSKESRVVLQAEKESWIKIEDGRGISLFSRVLMPGDVYYVPLGDKYKATFGNAGGVDVWVDGQLLVKLGPANTKKAGISMNPESLKLFGFAN